MPKGNISLIMLFVLAIGSVIGLMSTNFLQSMIRETSSMQTSYQTYYLAKAWVELGTLAVNRYDYGFEDELTGGSTIFKDNLKSCGSGCVIDMKITSRFTAWVTGLLIGNTPEPIPNWQCTDLQSIKIPACSSQILPLFLDNRKLWTNTSSLYKDIIDNAQDISFISNQNNKAIWLGLVLWSWDRTSYDIYERSNEPSPLFITGIINSNNNPNSNILLTSEIKNAITNNDHYFNYLTITNISSDTINGCIRFQNPWNYALDTSLVTSTATFKNSSLSLKWLVKKPLAWYVIDNCYNESESETAWSPSAASIIQ